MQTDPPGEPWYEELDQSDEGRGPNGKAVRPPSQRPGDPSSIPAAPVWDLPLALPSGPPVRTPATHPDRPGDARTGSRPARPVHPVEPVVDPDPAPAAQPARPANPAPAQQHPATTQPQATTSTKPVRDPAPTTPTVQREAVNIAMFGPTSGGKTTFLLGVLNGKPDPARYGTWAAIPPESSEIAEHLYHRVRDHLFPDATATPTDETWVIAGTYPRSAERKGLFRRQATAPREVQFNLQVVDSPGKNLLAMSREMIDTLARADGLVLLFDPLLMMPKEELEMPDGEAAPEPMFNYLQRTLPSLLGRQLNEGGAVKLPHHLAVCVSKFDDNAVYEKARQIGLVERDHDGQPRVTPGANAKQLFTVLCAESTEPNDHLLPGLIDQYFMPERISYHVVSAIGFYMEPRRGFADHDYGNVDLRGGKKYIRRLAPQQVWEALISVYESVAAARRA